MDSLGRSLLKKNNSRRSKKRVEPVFTASITERNDLDEFLAVANLSGKTFASTPAEDDGDASPSHQDPRKWLRLPRRPLWDSDTTPEQLKGLEETEFLNWRRRLARIQDSDLFLLTPFEKNLEVWRQLWRVIELADVIVQIVDARNPLFFTCFDIFDYCKDISPSKKSVILLNKADLLPQDVRVGWVDYFKALGIDCFLFSAKHTVLPDGVPSSQELIDSLAQLGTSVGFVGYPNVGKSSTINSLLSAKKVSVSSTPGKTKHYQSFILDNGLKIYDCPGLVFPSITSCKEELIVNGVLSIDQLKDYLSPVEYLLKQKYVSPRQIESLYKIKLPPLTEDMPKGYSSVDVLSVLAHSRGFHTSVYGNPDLSRAARILLKDFVEGNLLHFHRPSK